MSLTDGPPDRHVLLVVDDEVEVTRSLFDLFRLEYTVLMANSGPAALDILRRQTVHVILADHRMPGMTGAQLLARARGLPGEAVRLIMTGYADIKVVIDAVNRGHVFGYIEKPWNPDELRAFVSQAAGQYNLLAERRRLIHKLSTANRQLTRTGRAKSAFMELAGHELRTPLTYLLGMSETLARLPPNTTVSQLAPRLVRMAAGCRRMAAVLDNMLKSLASDSFRMELQPETFPLAALFDEVVALFADFLEQRRLTVTVAVSHQLPDLTADRPKVRDILFNVLSNAIRFTPDGGHIRLAARFARNPTSLNGHIIITVTDTGVGIIPADLPHVFEPFYTTADIREHSTAENLEFAKRGAGLGLAIVKRFAELHGGWARVASSQPGHGTTLEVTLPLQPVSKFSPLSVSPNESDSTGTSSADLSPAS